MFTTDGRTGRADHLIEEAPAKQWRRISSGNGAHGQREYFWVRIPIRIAWAPGHGHWLLARRSLSDPTEIAYYICAGSRRTTFTQLATVAGSRWRVEGCFQQAKNEAGLDHCQVRSYRALVRPHHLVDARARLALWNGNPSSKEGIGFNDQ